MKTVKDFYKDTPFNFSNDLQIYLESIKNLNQILEYKDLHKLLLNPIFTYQKTKVNSIIEFGCGTGWLCNTIARYYKKKDITAIDFTSKALLVAKQVSSKLNININYKEADIFDYSDKRKYDLVVSTGVLHHTKDCRKALDHISKFVDSGGHIYIGLYHLYSRTPMLNFLQSKCRWYGENASYNLFKRMNESMNNLEHNYSWFRDQVLHPHETQHTYEEVLSWFEDLGFKVVSTSINNYANIKKFKKEELFKLERKLEEYSYIQNVKKLQFNPGFFTVCAKKVIG